MQPSPSTPSKLKERLASLDFLRGADLFCIVAIEPIVHALRSALPEGSMDGMMWYFDHVEWEGLSTWDLIMPLFLFMSGVSVPFALGRHKEGGAGWPVYRRILRRFVLLWLFGMLCQGNLLALDPHHVYLYSNTLQAIAVGYLASTILFLNAGWRTMLATFVGLLAAFALAMGVVTVGDYGGGDYTQAHNLAEWIDTEVLGRFRDGATVVDGKVVVPAWNTYTWILSSLTFAATTLSGTLCGMVLKAKVLPSGKKLTIILGGGAAMLAAGYAASALGLPIIKRIWSSSFVLVSSGWCLLLMGGLYWWIDMRNHKRGLTFLTIYGTNSITAYMLALCISFKSIVASIFYGTEHIVGSGWYGVVLAAGNAFIIFLVLRAMYRKGVFLKV